MSKHLLCAFSVLCRICVLEILRVSIKAQKNGITERLWKLRIKSSLLFLHYSSVLPEAGEWGGRGHRRERRHCFIAHQRWGRSCLLVPNTANSALCCSVQENYSWVLEDLINRWYSLCPCLTRQSVLSVLLLIPHVKGLTIGIESAGHGVSVICFIIWLILTKKILYQI